MLLHLVTHKAILQNLWQDTYQFRSNSVLLILDGCDCLLRLSWMQLMLSIH